MVYDNPLFNEISDLEQDFTSGEGVTILPGLKRSAYDKIKMVTAYSIDQHLSGQKDDLNREKPFYNIGKYRLNVAVRATDFNTKDIRVEADHTNYSLQSLVLQKRAINWMKDENFAKTLNKMGRTRPEYGGVLVKKIEKGNELHIEVPVWTNVIFDETDIEDGVKIEKHWFNPMEFEKKRDVWENIDDTIKFFDKKEKKNSISRVCVYEIEGIFKKDFMLDVDESDEYSLQLHYVAGYDGEYVHLYSEELKESRYKYLDWYSVPGCALGRGVIEDGEQAQIWTNLSKMQEQNLMEYGSKLVLSTTDKNIEGTNLTTNIDTGEVVYHAPGTELSQLDLTPRTMVQLENLFTSWDQQIERVTSTFDSVTGETLPANTPLGSVQIQSANASSFFEYRRQEMGIFLTEIFTDWVMPYLVKQLKKEGLLTADFSPQELEQIDRIFATEQTNQAVLDQLTNPNVPNPTPETQQLLNDQFRSLIRETGERRTIKFPKDFFDDIKYKVTWVTTNEQKNKNAVLANLNQVLQTVAQNPIILQDPRLSQLFGKMVEVAGLGLSPVSLGIVGGATQQPTQQANVRSEVPEEVKNENRNTTVVSQ